MNMLIYGAGLLGKQIHHLVSAHFSSDWKVLGFVDDDATKTQSTIADGLRNLGPLEAVSSDGAYAPQAVRLALAIGYSDMKARREAFRRAKAMGYRFETLVHPRAHVERDVHLGEGVIILAGAVVDQSVTVGDVNYLDIGTLVGEDSVLGANNYLSAGTTIGGGVTIGEDNFVGLGVTVVNDVSIGNNNFINAQTLVYKPLGDDRKLIELHDQRKISRSR
ncbi:MAG: hypothetical protein JSV19_10300 [Phycisphaerales bacterium]|nr:MAG: hypothetical protein JSV19_10300 [Phycisphaerales bacterium]